MASTTASAPTAAQTALGQSHIVEGIIGGWLTSGRCHPEWLGWEANRWIGFGDLALVISAWREPVQKHRFRVLHLDPDVIDRIERGLKARPHIAAHPRGLVLMDPCPIDPMADEYGEARDSDEEGGNADDDDFWQRRTERQRAKIGRYLQTAARIVALLPSVMALRFGKKCGDVWNQVASESGEMKAMVSRVRSLHFGNKRYQLDNEQISQMLTGLSGQLQHLTTLDISFNEAFDHLREDDPMMAFFGVIKGRFFNDLPNQLPSLAKLSIGNLDTQVLGNIVNAAPNLRMLEIRARLSPGGMWAKGRSSQAAITRLASRITSLRLDVDDYDPQIMARFTELETLTLCGIRQGHPLTGIDFSKVTALHFEDSTAVDKARTLATDRSITPALQVFTWASPDTNQSHPAEHAQAKQQAHIDLADLRMAEFDRAHPITHGQFVLDVARMREAVAQAGLAAWIINDLRAGDGSVADAESQLQRFKTIGPTADDVARFSIYHLDTRTYTPNVPRDYQ